MHTQQSLTALFAAALFTQKTISSCDGKIQNVNNRAGYTFVELHFFLGSGGAGFSK